MAERDCLINWPELSWGIVEEVGVTGNRLSALGVVTGFLSCEDDGGSVSIGTTPDDGSVSIGTGPAGDSVDPVPDCEFDRLRDGAEWVSDLTETW